MTRHREENARKVKQRKEDEAAKKKAEEEMREVPAQSTRCSSDGAELCEAVAG